MANSSLIVPFFLKWEGGLSRDSNDPASGYPCPTPYNGKTGYHTNKGITYQSFRGWFDNQNQYSISQRDALFYTMPNNVWDAIYKTKYWDKFNLDSTVNQALANVVVSWAWGSGNSGAYSQLRKFVKNRLNKDFSYTYTETNAKELVKYLDLHFTTEMFYELCKYRETFFISLNSPFEEGWLNRLAEFIKFNDQFLTGGFIKYLIAGILIYWVAKS